MLTKEEIIQVGQSVALKMIRDLETKKALLEDARQDDPEWQKAYLTIVSNTAIERVLSDFMLMLAEKQPVASVSDPVSVGAVLADALLQQDLPDIAAKLGLIPKV